MNNQALILLSLLLVPSCNQQPTYSKEGENPEVTIKRLKNTNTFYYQIAENRDSIGYDVFEETGEINSVVNIKIVNKYVFLSDAVHGNVKRVDLESGELIASEKLDTDSSWLNSIAYFNNLLYVFTLQGNVYLLDKNLEKKGGFFLPDYIGDIDTYSENDDVLKIYRISSDDFYQDNNRKNFLRRMLLDKNNHYSFDTISLEIKEYLSRLGKEIGKEIRQGNTLFFETVKGKYEIPNSIDTKKDYDCKRIDFSDDYIVFFNVNPKRFKLVVYEY